MGATFYRKTSSDSIKIDDGPFREFSLNIYLSLYLSVCHFAWKTTILVYYILTNYMETKRKIKSTGQNDNYK